MRKQIVSELQSIVIKVGTSVLTDVKGNISRARIRQLVNGLLALLEKNKKVTLVSSGAIAYGMEVLGLSVRPKKLPRLQACAAIGQGCLMRIYEELFAKKGYHTGQLLLTRDGLNDRKRYANAYNTIEQLHTLGIIPIINENDTVSTEEINFGDNDMLAAQVASLIRADLLVLLSDIDGLYVNRSGKKTVFGEITTIDEEIRSHIYSNKNEKTRGGMESKLDAASLLMEAGISMVIANGKKKGILEDLISGKREGTLFFSHKGKKASYKNWLSIAPVCGCILVDEGAKDVLAHQGKSLLAVGITGVKDSFKKGDVVSICSLNGLAFAQGVVNYSSRELNTIKGKTKDDIYDIFGTVPFDEVIHRRNLVITKDL